MNDVPVSFHRLPLFVCTVTALWLGLAGRASAATLANGTFDVEVGENGEISSLELVGDAFPTNYVLNAGNAPGQDTSDHEWVGELMFSYRFGTGAFQTALTQSSADARQVQSDATSVTVTYANSASDNGIKNFQVGERYALVDDYLSWEITLTNTSSQTLELGDVGLPLPFNEYWAQTNDVIYETRTVYHSFTGQDSSYITVQRPSGVGPFLLMTPDSSTSAGFEYMDNWIASEHPGSAWAAKGGTPAWSNGLDVFYIHSNAIKKTNRGYLPNTSLMLAAGASQTYAFKFFKVATQDDVKSRLYQEGLLDVTVVPGMMFSSDMTAKIDLHSAQKINSLTAQFPSESVITPLAVAPGDHDIYELRLSHLGQNDVTVSYGAGKSTTLQFYVLEPIDAAFTRHATFMVKNTVAATGGLAHVFDDWMMDAKSVRGAVGGGGWGDDWGWTKAEFLAEKDAQTPVAGEIATLDGYLDAVWQNAIDPNTFVVQDWWCPAGTSAFNPNDCFYNRPYAYPHAFNTYFSMYKIASLYPNLATFHNSPDTYLMRAYGILHSLYSGGPPPPMSPATISGTGYMGEQTLPDIMRALAEAGHSSESAFVKTTIDGLHAAFSGNPYPYGSEYKYDNTGEEAVYMAAKEDGDTAILSKVNAKTRACRGHEPVWYYYADPVTLNGENWWQFQYTASLAGYCMDDFLRHQSTTPELDERLSYAAKIANVGAINSGQIDPDPANLGTVAWTYQAMKGNTYVNSFDPAGSTLHNGWRQMAGEADLGLFGALRILSTDVAVDPVFGLYAYGGDVSEAGGCYSITPRDGVFKRLNLITEKFHLELSRDRYSGATVSKARDYVGFTLQNQTGDAHTTNLTLEGLAPGTYSVNVDGTAAPAITAQAGVVATVALAVTGAASQAVTIAASTASCTGVGGATSSGGAPSVGGSAGAGAIAGNGGQGTATTGGGNGTAGATSSPPMGSGGTGVSGAGGTLGDGTTSVGGANSNDAPSGSRSNCACRAASSTSSSRAAWFTIAAFGVGTSRRRRAPRRRRQPKTCSQR